MQQELITSLEILRGVPPMGVFITKLHIFTGEFNLKIDVRITKDLSIDWDWLDVPTEAQFEKAFNILAAHDPEDKTVKQDKSRLDTINEIKTAIKAK
jgi:hypothetical protein